MVPDWAAGETSPAMVLNPDHHLSDHDDHVTHHVTPAMLQFEVLRFNSY